MRGRRLPSLSPIVLDSVVSAPVRGKEAPGKTFAYLSNLFSGTISIIGLDRMVRLHDFKAGPYPIFTMAVYAVRLGTSQGREWDSEAAAGAFSHPVDVEFSADPNVCYVTDTSLKALLYIDSMPTSPDATSMPGSTSSPPPLTSASPAMRTRPAPAKTTGTPLPPSI